jgi:putative nucleotidyltransferase with HDIG domain
MTARILKLVNSAFFGLRRQVSSPNEAVNYLGMDAIKALVLSINAFAKYENCSLGGIALEPLWNHSLMTAGFAKAVASAKRGGSFHSEDAFVAGMLHDAGKLVLAANFSAEYSEVIASIPEGEDGLLGAEERTFGANHAEIGGHLLALWGLPEAIVDAVTWHHQPQRCAKQSFGPLVCVHAANVWAHAEAESEPSLSIDEEYIEVLGWTDQLAGWRDACLENQAGAA